MVVDAKCTCGHAWQDHNQVTGLCLERDRSAPCGCSSYRPRPGAVVLTPPGVDLPPAARPVLDLGILASIDREELIDLVRSLGLDPMKVEEISIRHDAILIDESSDSGWTITRRKVRIYARRPRA